MKPGLTISIIAHAVILGWGLVVLSHPMQFDAQENEALPVTLVPIGDTMSVQKGELNASNDEKPAPTPTTKPDEKIDATHIGDGQVDTDTPLKPKEKPRKVETSSPKAGAPEAKDNVAPHQEAEKPKPAEDAKPPEPKAEEKSKPQAEDKAKPIAETKPAEAQPDLTKPQEKVEKSFEETPASTTDKPEQEAVTIPQDVPVPSHKPTQNAVVAKSADTKGDKQSVDDLVKEALLVDKTKTQGGGAKRSDEAAGFGASKDINASDQMIQTYANIISSCTKSKFDIVALGGSARTDLKLKAHFFLKNDGSLDGTPEITALGGDSRQQEVGINQARAALVACSPFPLPTDQYGSWHEIEIIFDPFSP